MIKPVRRKRKLTTRKIGKPIGQVFVGIDPGKQGGIAAITSGGIVVNVGMMPETDLDLWKLISGMDGVTFTVVEKVWGMAGEGGAASFTFGKGYGSILMALTASKRSFLEVTPREWQKHYQITPKKKGETKPQHKEKLRVKAQQLFPTLSVWDSTLKIQRAVCDALLIAMYCRDTQGVPF